MRSGATYRAQNNPLQILVAEERDYCDSDFDNSPWII